MPMKPVAEREEPVERDVLQFPGAPAEPPVTHAHLDALSQRFEAQLTATTSAILQRIPSIPEREPVDAQTLEILAAISQVLAVRVTLFVAIIMTFVMAWRAMSEPGAASIAVLVLFGMLSVGPLAWLASRKTG